MRTASGSACNKPACALAVMIALALTSCNTTDALTPQVDVGGGLTPSNPVSQADTERMASTPPSGRAQSGYGADGYPPAPAGNRRGPQNSLEAQARAIDAGSNSPVESAPLAPPSGASQPSRTSSPTPNTATAASPPPSSAPSQSAAASGTIRFLPIIGAPVQAVTPLSRQLGMRARAAGLTIKASGDASSQHILKGYLSAFADGGKITVVFVWDVLDNSGQRLHRLQGQESVAGSGSDPWAKVPASTMEAIARETIDGYMEWLSAQPG